MPRPDGGGRVHIRWHRSPKGVKGAVIVPLAWLTGPRMFRRQWTQVLDGVAAEHGTAGRSGPPDADVHSPASASRAATSVPRVPRSSVTGTPDRRARREKPMSPTWARPSTS